MNFNNKKHEEEIDFKNIKENPIRWFGAVYPYFIVVIIFIGIYYTAKLNTINMNNVPPAIVDTSKIWHELSTVQGSVVKGVDISLIKSPSANFIEKGKTSFTSTCAPCHGNEGKGDGPAGGVLNPKPRNFTSSEGWINGRKFADIYKTLQEGIKGSAMTAYEFLPIEDRVSIIQYIRTLASDFPVIDDNEIASLNSTYGLAGDRITPNQIPVSKAIMIINNENLVNSDKVELIAKEIKSDESSAAKIFKKICTNTDKALSQLMNNQSWKESPEIFVSIAANAGPKNGFSPVIASYSKEEIMSVFNYLKTKI